MRFLKYFLLIIYTIFYSQEGFQVVEGEKAVLPFKLINNLIFIPVNVNGVELTFLLDSGISETILFSLENKDVSFNNVEKIKFSGLGEDVDIEGLKSVKNHLSIGKNYKDNAHTIYVILNEDINFSSHIGVPVNGMIGYHFFKNHPIKIDYVSKKITIFSTQEALKNKIKNFESLPITVELNKPYVLADVEMTNEKKKSKLLLDLGNSDAVWLFPSLIKDFIYNRPNIDDFLGRGFNGDIFGKRSRIHGLHLGKFAVEKPLVAMPDEYSIQHLKIVKDRKGSIGSDVLRRFTIIFNYPENTIYLKKNRFFGEPFLFNKSGLDIRHDGLSWEGNLVKVETQKKETQEIEVYNSQDKFQYKFVLKPQYSIAGCRKEAPCYEAGIRKGDRLITINSKKSSDLTLEKINEFLKDDEGKLIELEIERNGEKLKYHFNLKDPIPYQEN